MIFRFALALLFVVFLPRTTNGSPNQHIEVAMRLIGHYVMLHVGDSQSVVKPVRKIDNQYRIEFSTDFEFEPSSIASIIDSVMKVSHVANSYQVAIIPCAGSEMVYGYEITATDSLVPCVGRTYPKACYSLLITLPDVQETEQNQSAGIVAFPLLLLGFLIAVVAIGYLLLRSRKQAKTQPAAESSEIVHLGNFQFDPKNMYLIMGDQSTELTGKEGELLALLLQHLNETVERDTLLNTVWGDEGDYVGRTLDVFISKLRKKLETDPNVRIVSIRGVGYKLILNG
jgi:hypothetical protein